MNQLRGRVRVWLAEIKNLFALRGNGDLVDDHVEFATLQRRDNAAPLGRNELRFYPELRRHGFCDIDVEAFQLTVLVARVERRIGAFETDLQDSSPFDRVEQIFGMSRYCGKTEGGDG
ncbi:hypothetical protein OKW34_004965 [Paraburkholderia youngii]